MKDYCSKVNVFFGCDPVDLPKRHGFAAAWRPIKGRCGNTSPEAVLPFSKMSCCSYSGAYPTGYGNCTVNSHRPIKPMFPFHRFCGFTHIRPSGTGFIDYFYNFALISPVSKPEKILSEDGVPGYYSCVTDSGKFDCTVTENCAFHRFSFVANSGKVTVDFSQYGLQKSRSDIYTNYDRAVCFCRDNTVLCSTSFYGVPIYFAMRAKNALAVSLFADVPFDNDRIEFDSYRGKFGAVFDFSKMGETVLSISFLSLDHAETVLNSDFDRSFDDVRASGYEKWNEMLSRIDVSGDENDERLFYSNLYFSLVKPTDVSDEKLYGFDGDAITDIATMWDMYKTELPLLFTVYPEIGEKVIATMLSFYDKEGFLPNSYLISPEQSLQTGQAKFLSAYVFADAFLRDVGDKAEMYRVLRAEYLSDAFADFRATGREKRTTHTMDLYEGQMCLSLLADSVGDAEFAQKLRMEYQKIASVFSKRTGLLHRRSKYYEGNFLNYSFRLLSDDALRVSAAGGKDKYLKSLDYFFGYRHPSISYGKFEGFNNETDMETPYAYHFIGRHDRISEIIDASRKYMWRLTRGGMPGNNDTGALSSMYVWNSLGLFPVSGQNRMIVGTPLFDRVTMPFCGAKLTVVRQGSGIYVSRAELNGVDLPALQCSLNDLKRGGELVLFCSDRPDCN